MTACLRKKRENFLTAAIKINCGEVYMFRKVKNITLQFIAGANIATIILMLFIGYSDRVNPVEHPIIANAGLVFPVFLLLNFCFLVFWICFKWRGVIIPVAGFLLCYFPMRTYIPFNVSSDAPTGSIKVLSYNVWCFAGGERNADGKNPILEYIREQNADIVCLQEANAGELGKARLDAVMDSIYQYKDTAMSSPGGDCIALYSKFPILSRERIHYKSKGNLSMAYGVKIGNDTVLVVNNHLETTGLSNEERSQFKTMLKGEMKSKSAEHTSKLLVEKLGEASVKRAPEAEAVERYLSMHEGRSIILCGDFNDSPISYVHRVIAKNLIDCYVESGNGPGISYHHSGFYVRIDNIMCSEDWRPYNCKVDDKIKDSDHYPISCLLKKR